MDTPPPPLLLPPSLLGDLVSNSMLEASEKARRKAEHLLPTVRADRARDQLGVRPTRAQRFLGANAEREHCRATNGDNGHAVQDHPDGC